MTKKISYSEAVKEIEEIIQKMENEEWDVDEIANQVKRVALLLKICREKLRSTESEVGKIMKEMNEEGE